MEREELIKELHQCRRQSIYAARAIEAGVELLQPEYTAALELKDGTNRADLINDLYPQVILNGREARRLRREAAVFDSAILALMGASS